MERKLLDAGKKAAQDLAPNPKDNTPEAPIISEEEAQILESPDGSGPETRLDEQTPEDVRRQAGNSGDLGDNGIRITPKNE
jgi:hypothetical protein